MTRHNLCTNPAAGTDLTGWTSSSNSPVRLTGLTGMPRTTGVRSTASGFFRTPVAPCSPGQQFTLSFYMLNNTGSFQFGHTVYVSYTTTGAEQFPETFNTPNTDIGAVSRASKVTTIASVPANATGIFLIIDTMPADIIISAVLFEPDVSALDTYFDGTFASCSWDGTPELSASTFTNAVNKSDGDTASGTDSAGTLNATLFGAETAPGLDGSALTAAQSGTDTVGAAETAALTATKTDADAVGVAESASVAGNRSWRALEGGSAAVNGGQIEGNT